MIIRPAHALLLLCGSSITSNNLARLAAADTLTASRLLEEDLEDHLLVALKEIQSKNDVLHSSLVAPLYEKEEFHDETFDTSATNINNHDRELVECGEVYQTFTIDEVKAQVQAYISSSPAVGPEETAAMIEGILPQLRFGVEFRKICASCDSIMEDGSVEESMLSDENFLKYCGEDAYGSDTMHSGTVMFPMTLGDDGSYSIIRAKDELQSWLQFRSVAIANADSNVLLTVPITPSFNNQLIASSAGLVSLSFHQTGYGTSISLVPSPMNRNSVVTSSLPIFYKARSMLLQETDGISYLGNEAYFSGTSEGGYSSISAADSFKSMGIQPIHVMSSCAPLKVRSEGFLGFLRSLLSGNLANPLLQVLIVMLIGLPMSNTRPGVANYESGQYAIAEDVTNDTLSLFTSQLVPSPSLDPLAYGQYLAINYPGIFTKITTSPLDLFGPEVISLFYTAVLENDDDPCANKYSQGIGVYDKICDALDENDLREIVASADFNIDICHSLTDELASYRNVPDKFDPSFVTIFTIPEATHAASALFCGVRALNLISENPFNEPKLLSLVPSSTPSLAPTTAYATAVCGGATNKCNPKTKVDIKTATYGVRCCNETKFKWSKKKPWCSVWASSRVGKKILPTDKENCKLSATFEEAESYCEHSGARLCTKQELLEQCAKSTGCGLNKVLVWSNEPAAPLV